MRPRQKLNLVNGMASLALLVTGLAIAFNFAWFGWCAWPVLVTWLVLVYGKNRVSKQLDRDVAFNEELEQKLYEDAYTHPNHRPDPDKYIGGAG